MAAGDGSRRRFLAGRSIAGRRRHSPAAAGVIPSESGLAGSPSPSLQGVLLATEPAPRGVPEPEESMPSMEMHDASENHHQSTSMLESQDDDDDEEEEEEEEEVSDDDGDDDDDDEEEEEEEEHGNDHVASGDNNNNNNASDDIAQPPLRVVTASPGSRRGGNQPDARGGAPPPTTRSPPEQQRRRLLVHISHPARNRAARRAHPDDDVDDADVDVDDDDDDDDDAPHNNDDDTGSQGQELEQDVDEPPQGTDEPSLVLSEQGIGVRLPDNNNTRNAAFGSLMRPQLTSRQGAAHHTHHERQTPLFAATGDFLTPARTMLHVPPMRGAVHAPAAELREASAPATTTATRHQQQRHSHFHNHRPQQQQHHHHHHHHQHQQHRQQLHQQQERLYDMVAPPPYPYPRAGLEMNPDAYGITTPPPMHTAATGGAITPVQQQQQQEQQQQQQQDINTRTPMTTSRTTIGTITGEHEHTISGYSLIKGIGDGEPIASERFSVGGHEWVLLFYPDGKRSQTSGSAMQVHGIPGGVDANEAFANEQAFAAAAGPAGAGLATADRQERGRVGGNPGNADAAAGAGRPGDNAARPAGMHQVQQALIDGRRHATRDFATRDNASGGSEYVALFVALIAEGSNPQGVVNSSEGRVVRAFHRFTLVDQNGTGNDVSKGRRRDQGAVKISCARSDPNARNCHGYRKFVRRTHLENPTLGFLKNDCLLIRYHIELVVASGGALDRNAASIPPSPRLPLPELPPPQLGAHLGELLETGRDADVTFEVDGEMMRAHKLILTCRSPVFHALLSAPMREGNEGVVRLQDIKAEVFRAMLHFVYTANLPEEHSGDRLEVPMTQHLLAAADRFNLARLRTICERKLCESMEVETAATTLALAEQNRALDLKRVCLDFVANNLSEVMATDGFTHMSHSCPHLQAEVLRAVADLKNNAKQAEAEEEEDTAAPAAAAAAAAAAATTTRRDDDRSNYAQTDRRVRQRRS